MADITMCDNGYCERRYNCYRFTAEPNPQRQSYFLPTPLADNCGHFSSNVGKHLIQEITNDN